MQPHNESSNNNKANYDKSNRNGSYYYDLHTHIIPGVDDGSDSLKESLKNKNALTIADTKYILVEFLPGDSAKKIYAALREYIMEGYIPIVAHIERYEKLYKNYDFLDELINMGAYIQMNTESIVGGLFDRHAAYFRKLLMNGYVHFLGSDCHGANRRKPLMKAAIEKLKPEFVNSSLAEKILFENPIKMLEGKYI